MSRLRIFNDNDPSTVLLETDHHVVMGRELAAIGVRFQQWHPAHALEPGASPEAVMEAYRSDIDRLVKQYGFRSVDVVSIAPDHPDREAMRTKFLDEHYHKEDEVRFFVAGDGLFTLHVGGKVYEVLCVAGDLIGVPDGIHHWFDMGPEPYFIAIRFFKEPDGWIGYFTGTDIAKRFPRYEAGQAL